MADSSIKEQVVRQMWDFYLTYDVKQYAVKADSLQSVSGPTGSDPKQETLGGPEMIVDPKNSSLSKKA